MLSIKCEVTSISAAEKAPPITAVLQQQASVAVVHMSRFRCPYILLKQFSLVPLVAHGRLCMAGLQVTC